METKAVGMRIKQARENANITQSELAASVGCTMQHIGAIERGIKTPRLDTFIQIACILQVPADLLLQDVLPRTSDLLGTELSASIAPLPDEIKQGILKAIQAFCHEMR